MIYFNLKSIWILIFFHKKWKQRALSSTTWHHDEFSLAEKTIFLNLWRQNHEDMRLMWFFNSINPDNPIKKLHPLLFLIDRLNHFPQDQSRIVYCLCRIWNGNSCVHIYSWYMYPIYAINFTSLSGYLIWTPSIIS